MRKEFLWIGFPLILVGCRPTNLDDKVHLRLSVFSGRAEQKFAESLVRGFEARHPGIAITVEPVPTANYGSKLGMQSAAGTLPDVVFMVDSLLPILSKYRVIQDLGPFMKMDRNFDPSDIYPKMLENGTDDAGRLLMLPRELGVVVMFYNRTLLRRAGLADPPANWTREEFLSYARKLTYRGPDGRIIQYGFNGQFSWPGLYAPMIVGEGGALLSKDGEHSTLSSGNSLRALHELVDLVTTEHVAIPPGQSLSASGGDPFVQGQVAMEPGVFPMVPNLRATMKSFDWDAQVMPSGSRSQKTMTGAAGYGISSTTTHPKESWQFLKYIVSPEGQRILASTGTGIPSLKRLRHDPTWRNSKLPPRNIDAFLNSEKIGMTWRGILLFSRPEVDDIVRNAFEQSLAGRESVEKAFGDADRRIDAVMKADQEDR